MSPGCTSTEGRGGGVSVQVVCKGQLGGDSVRKDMRTPLTWADQHDTGKARGRCNWPLESRRAVHGLLLQSRFPTVTFCMKQFP